MSRRDVARREVLFPIQIGLLAVAAFLSPIVAAGLSQSHVPEISMQILVLLASMVWMVRARRDGVIELPSKGLFVTIAVLLVVGALSLVRTVSLHATLLGLISLICYAIIFLMVGSWHDKRYAVYSIVAAVLLSTIVVGGIGLKESLLTTIPDWRVFSTFFNPDFLAGFMAMVLPIALAWYLSDTSLGISMVAGLAVLMSLTELLMSGSRFGAAAAVGGMWVFLLIAIASRSLGRRHVLRAGILLCLCVLITILAGGTLASRVAAVNAESHSGGFRIQTWKGAAEMVRDHLFLGTGLGTFEVAYPRYAQVGWTRLAHNSYLQYAAEGGIVLPLALLILIGMAVIPAARGLRSRAVQSCSDWMPDRSLLVCGLIGGATASMARNLVDSDWYVAAIGTTFWIILGALVALGPERGSWKIAMPEWLCGAKLAGHTVIVLGMVSVLIAQGYYAGGWALLGSGQREDALKAFRLATRYDPLDADLHRRLGVVLRMVSESSGDRSHFGAAEKELERAAELEPTAPKTYYQLGKLYANDLHDDNRAVKAYLAALDRDPHAVQVLTALAETYDDMGEPSDALKVYQRMAAQEDSVYERVRAIPEIVEPGYIFAREALGRYAECRGDKSDARRQYGRALDRIARYEASIGKMGPVMEQMGTRDKDLEARIGALRGQIESRLKALDEGARPG